MRVRELMRDLAELDPDMLVVTDVPSEENPDDIFDLRVDIVGVRRLDPPFVLLETERRQ